MREQTRRPQIEIELHAPLRVDGRPARLQSLWLLLSLWMAARTGDGSGWVRESQLRERFPGTRNLRMVVSRAYADFARWGLRVGWGKDRGRAPELLTLSGRNRGPFWLAPGEAERLRILLQGRPMEPGEVTAWLGRSASGESLEMMGVPEMGLLGLSESGRASPAYWHAWADARRDMLDGRLIVDGGQGALAGYRRAQSLAPNDWLRALALLQQAMVWRRAGNADAARAVLTELDRHWHDEQAPEHAWLGAMAAIVRAWCAYAGRDAMAARQILRDAAEDPRWTGLFRYHPRVRSEYANLQALIHRAHALDNQLGHDERTAAARAALGYYRQALALANEAELFDAAASAASNLGWSLWLFSRCGLDLNVEGEHPALAWIALAAWLRERHAVGGGFWNAIYLLRMVRNGGSEAVHPDSTQFRRWPVMSPAHFHALTAPIQLRAPYPRWLDLAMALQADVDAGRVQVDALQRANLLLELAWYQAYEGDLGAAGQAASRLRRRLRELPPADRIFFREALRRLPQDT
ncbi:MAG: hypothetical protein E6Q88_00145 [Lysobacteraceae bacterium]|nr:MAG: hypothetical protein E6Q88_00145 [Xanthomonadaceae bacterium]